MKIHSHQASLKSYAQARRKVTKSHEKGEGLEQKGAKDAKKREREELNESIDSEAISIFVQRCLMKRWALS